MAAFAGPDPLVMEAIERGNAVVFFDICLGEGENAAELGRIKLELFVKDVRMIMLNGFFVWFGLVWCAAMYFCVLQCLVLFSLLCRSSFFILTSSTL
jgi:hypothetical protein